MEKNNASKLINKLLEHNIDAALITGKENIRYFSGFTSADAALLITAGSRKYIITDFRYFEQCGKQCPDFEIMDLSEKKLGGHLKDISTENDIKRIWFEDTKVSYKDYALITDAVNPVKLIPDEGILTGLRLVKTDHEIENIAKAAAIADQGFLYILDNIECGMSEKQVALELEIFLRKHGSEGLAFEIIAASGDNGSMPHARPGDRVLRKGDMLTLDFGCVVNGYCSDMTRTIAFGEPVEKLSEIYKIVLDAQQLALNTIRPGLTGSEVDKIARDYITEKGYGSCFGHGLGHGVGLYIHEEPRLSKTSGIELAGGMVVTVEPGIYIPGVGGVRIEDLIVLTDNGYKNLTSSPKELIKI